LNENEEECEQDQNEMGDETGSHQEENQYERPKRNKSAGHSIFTPIPNVLNKKIKKTVEEIQEFFALR